MKTIPYEKFKHGQRVTCEIDGVKIDDAKISIDKDGEVFICQNKYDGDEPEDKLGYKYGWKITYKKVEFFDGKESVKNLQFLPRTLDDLEEGDIVVDSEGIEKTIVGICGQIVFLSNRKEIVSYWLLSNMKSRFTLKQGNEEWTETLIRDFPVFITKDEEKMKYKGKTYILSKYL